ncbi:superoxide dismutase family protein [Nesterenkonia suensis]
MTTDRFCSRVLSLTALSLGAGLLLTGCGDAEHDPAEDDSAQEQGAAGDDGAQDGADGADGADGGAGQGSGAAGEPFAQARIGDAADNDHGLVTFSEMGEGVQVQAELKDLDAGFFGFHIHGTGLCEPQSAGDDGEVGDFLSAGGHLAGEAEEDHGVVEGEEAPEDDGLEGQDAPGDQPHIEVDSGPHHPNHAGDLPNLLVTENGTATLTVVTDRLTDELLTGGEGAAVIIHSQPDNHGNIPERYAPAGPDEDTLATGDAGTRIACGVIEAP